MSQIEQLEMAVKALPKGDFDAFRQWVNDYDYDQWSHQIQQDSHDENSPIMKLAAQALEDHKQGKTKRL